MQQVWGLAVRQAQDQLQGERETLNAARKEIEQERAELSAEIERLDMAVEQAQSEARKAVEALDSEREAHNQTKEKLQGEVADLRQEATTARERAARLEGQVTTLKEQFEVLTATKPEAENLAPKPAPGKTTRKDHPEIGTRDRDHNPAVGHDPPGKQGKPVLSWG